MNIFLSCISPYAHMIPQAESNAELVFRLGGCSSIFMRGFWGLVAVLALVSLPWTTGIKVKQPEPDLAPDVNDENEINVDNGVNVESGISGELDPKYLQTCKVLTQLSSHCNCSRPRRNLLEPASSRSVAASSLCYTIYQRSLRVSLPLYRTAGLCPG